LFALFRDCTIVNVCFSFNHSLDFVSNLGKVFLDIF
jgi:hypothetical protein